MNDTTEEREARAWYHQIPNWVVALLMIFGAITAGVSAFGQVSRDSQRLDMVEPRVGALEGRMTSSEAHAQDEHDRLKRIEDKLDIVINDKAK